MVDIYIFCLGVLDGLQGFEDCFDKSFVILCPTDKNMFLCFNSFVTLRVDQDVCCACCNAFRAAYR